MALACYTRSLFLYNYPITSANGSIDFLNVNAGSTITATVAPGNYSLTGLLAAIATALNAADINNIYTVTANRTLSSGTQNRVTIATSGAFLTLLFGSGPNVATSIAGTIGFTSTDKTGATTYTGTNTTGTILQPTLAGYTYLDNNFKQKLFGSINISSSGKKEAISYPASNLGAMQFMQVQYKYEPKTFVIASWQPFLLWMIQQRPFDFTPDVTNPTSFYNVTLESTAADANGMEYEMKEMLPEFPNLYDTGMLKFRVVI